MLEVGGGEGVDHVSCQQVLNIPAHSFFFPVTFCSTALVQITVITLSFADGEIEDLKRRIGDTIMQIKQDSMFDNCFNTLCTL